VKRQDDQSRRNNNIALIVGISLLSIILFLIFTSVSSQSGKTLIPISIVALIAGLLFEGKRLSEKWSTVFYITIGSLAFSFFAFVPGKHERHYNIEDHVAMWPYLFIFIFAILSVIAHGDKVVPKLTEGITLLQSIAVIYWVVDYDLFAIQSYFVRSLIIIGLIFSSYSLFHAFTYSTLTRTRRLALSLWSSVIMCLFAVDNILRVYQNEQIENTVEITHGLYVALQFFLLGVSSIYITQNLMMLWGYLPGKGTFFNSKYFADVRELNDQHIKRYSDDQVYIGHSIICSILSIALFAVNYYYAILPRHLAIWAVFAIVPLLMSTFQSRTSESKYST
jgi:hypothetical protein